MNRLLIILAFTFTSARLLSCSCIGFKSFYWHYNNADIIFKGQVIKIIEPLEPRGRDRKIVFKLLDKFKGQFNSDTILLKTGLGGGDCGLPLELNDIWIIFSAHRQASVCNANIKLSGQDSTIFGHPFGIYNSKWIQEKLTDISKGENKYIKEYNTKNQIISEGQISNKLAQGFWKYHFDYNVGMPGITDQKTFYKSGIKDSIEYEYYKDHKPYTQRGWKEGKLNSKEIYYFPNGKIYMTRNYINGVNDGEWKMFHKNGALRQRESYSNGVRQGVDLDLFENGDTSCVTYYNTNGKPLKTLCKYENKKTNFLWIYEYSDSLPTQQSLGYWENGNLRYKGYSVNSQSDGEQLIYYENGNIKEKKHYTLGKETGTWYFYDEDGKLNKEETK